MHDFCSRFSRSGCGGIVACCCVLSVLAMGLLLYVSLTGTQVIKLQGAHQRSNSTRYNHLFITAAPSATFMGDRIVFASRVTGDGDIYLLTRCKRRLSRIVGSPAVEASPVITPDGTAVAFCRENGRGINLWLMHMDNCKEIQLTYGVNTSYSAEFSADGRFLLYYRLKDSFLGQGRLLSMYVMDVKTPKKRSIDVGSLAVFSADGRTVFFTENQSAIWSVNLKDRHQRRVRIAGSGWPIGVSADNKVLLTGRSTTTATGIDDEIWVQDLHTGGARKIAVGHSAIIWGNEQQRIMFFKGYQENAFVTDIDGNSIVSLPLPVRTSTSFRMRPDRRAVLGRILSRSVQGAFGVISIDGSNLQITTIMPE